MTGTRVGISSPKKSEKIRGKIGFYILNYRWLFKISGESVLSSTNRMNLTNLTNLAPCTHEEADTRLMVHVLDASCCGHRRIMIRTSDTDVVVLAVSIVSRIPAEELWVANGTGKHLQNIAVHTIAAALGRERAFVLLMFHTLTGCDTVSFFAGRGKKTAWDIWVYSSRLQLHC